MAKLITAKKVRLLEKHESGKKIGTFDLKGQNKEVLSARMISEDSFQRDNANAGRNGFLWVESKESKKYAPKSDVPKKTTVDVKGKEIEKEVLIEAMGKIGIRVNSNTGAEKLQEKFNVLDEEKQIEIITILKEK